MTRDELLERLGRKDKHGEPIELFLGGSSAWGKVGGLRWLITYDVSHAVIDDELVKELIKSKEIFPVYLGHTHSYWRETYSIDLVASREAFVAQGLRQSLMLVVVDVHTGESSLMERPAVLGNRYPKKARGRPGGRITPRQRLIAALYRDYRSFEKVAKVLGCTRQNVDILWRSYIRNGGQPIEAKVS